MDDNLQITLAELIRTTPVASLGTLRNGAPMVSLVTYATGSDFTHLLIHLSQLAQHTQNIAGDPRVGLLVAEPARAGANPLALARVSLQGVAQRLQPGTPGYERAKDSYLAKHPGSSQTFELADFELFRIDIQAGRYVAGFGQIFDLGPDDLRLAASARR